MPYPISILPEYPKWDALSVLKLNTFPFAQDEFRPFSQCRLCLVENQGFYLRMWAFDVHPLSASIGEDLFQGDVLLCKFALSKEGAYLELSADSQGQFILRLVKADGSLLPLDDDAFSLRSFTGEDLQGEYWGFEAFLPLSLFSLLGNATFQAGSLFYANFWKVCLHPGSTHIGAFYPFSQPIWPFSQSCELGDFILTDY